MWLWRTVSSLSVPLTGSRPSIRQVVAMYSTRGTCSGSWRGGRSRNAWTSRRGRRRGSRSASVAAPGFLLWSDGEVFQGRVDHRPAAFPGERRRPYRRRTAAPMLNMPNRLLRPVIRASMVDDDVDAVSRQCERDASPDAASSCTGHDRCSCAGVHDRSPSSRHLSQHRREDSFRGGQGLGNLLNVLAAALRHLGLAAAFAADHGGEFLEQFPRVAAARHHIR